MYLLTRGEKYISKMVIKLKTKLNLFQVVRINNVWYV